LVFLLLLVIWSQPLADDPAWILRTPKISGGQKLKGFIRLFCPRPLDLDVGRTQAQNF
jgi:hypothetical protein